MNLTTLKLVPKRRFCGQRINGQEMIIKQYPVPLPTSITLGIGETFKSAEASVDVKWDPKKTIFNQALLVTSFHSFRGLFSIKAMEIRLYINDHLADARGWSMWEAQCITKGTEGSNIGAYLINGTNKFRLELSGSFEPITSGIDNIMVNFEAWFTGEEPTVKPTPPQWVNYAKWAAIGLGILGAVYIAIKVYEARKKK